jgi:excisionase family DNA binding protein
MKRAASRATGRAAADKNGSGPKNPTLATFYTVKDVAEALDVSTRSVRRWIECEELKVHELGHLIRIADDDLLEFLARRRR